MEEKITLNHIKNKIFTLQGKEVILDKDIALFFDIETRALKQAVKRNIERFPKDFIFYLNEKDIEYLVSQSVIPSLKHLGGSNPYAFTEQGVATLSGILKSKRAIKVSIQIMRAFVAMREFLSKNASFFQKFQQIDQKLLEHDNNFSKVFNALETKKPKQGIFFDGQMFDAYSFIKDLIYESKEIILVDNYVDYSTFKLFKDIKRVTIYTKNIPKDDYDKYCKQYNNIKIKKFDKSHDRFLIIDKTAYLIGASLKDLGKKWFGFFKIKDSKEIINKLT